jgi:hypothetical protein
MIKTEGYKHNQRIIFFIDPRGKDISFGRWRVHLYYHPNYAETFFLNSQEEYEKYLSKHEPLCYESYEKFCSDFYS